MNRKSDCESDPRTQGDPLPGYVSLLHLLRLYASDATRLDWRIFNIALQLYGSITATL